ncbi:M18 family aminopeptidase [Proteocatella sphenisci]|uniref:M18 family aminopeptidase n=1 Tax=Proteocatella sphenisci TaxID=181070 RepID=UPI00048DB894|nr:M18 family aminopeptidase [Proteocatella sphenisci]
MKSDIKDLFKFLDNAKSIYHVAQYSKNYLLENSFEEIDLNKKLDLKTGGRYFFCKKGSIFAFRIDSIDDGFKIIGSHTDSPSISIKNNAVINQDDYIKLNTEIYGGPILATWFDRPLSLAGCVHVKTGNPMEPEMRLLDFEKDVCIIPNLAIHMNREVNNGVKIDKQIHMLPIMGLSGQEVDKESLLSSIAANLKIEKDQILSYDLNLYDTQKASLVGINEEMISSKKIDNISMLQASLKALVESKTGKGIKIVAGFDGEEIGSSTQNGADSDILSNIGERILLSFGRGREDFLQSIEKSFIISADMAHSVHPNFSEKSDLTNKPKMNKGITIKQSANKKYTSDSKGTGVIISLCKDIDIDYQIFANRSDQAGGSTIGPISSTHFPIDSVDIGNPMLSMHSIRELAGTKDHFDIIKLFKHFYSL